MNFLVTGVSRGLGLEIARLLLENGHSVFGVSRSLTPGVQQLIDHFGERMIFIEFDLANADSVNPGLMKEKIGFDTPIHGFVNNAALAYDDIITNLDLNKLREMYEVNVFSPMNITKYIIRLMLLHKTRGSIVHISSISAHTGYKGLAMYASSKGALEAFSKNTAREWGEKGIRSNCLVAGFMETEMSSSLTDDQKNRIYQRTSLKQATQVSSVAETVLFLLSEASASITGQLINVDSGTI